MKENSSRMAAGVKSAYLHRIPAKKLEIPPKPDKAFPNSGDRKIGKQAK